MVLPTVLKRKHSLKGKQLLLVIRKLRDIQDAHGIKQLARTSSARRTENMSNEDVLKAVEDLTGENGIELPELAGKDPNDEDFAKLLLHVCILHANEKGQPKGQDLQDPELGHSSATTADREQGPTCTSNSRKATDKDQDSNGGKRRKLQDSTTEVKDKDGTQIQQVKDKIKVLCTQSQPSEALILLSLDELSRLARKVNHEDMDVYEELYRQCSRMQGKINMGNLCLTVLGGKGAGTVTKAINKCLKESGTSEVKRDNTSCKEDIQPPKQESVLANLYPPMPMYPMGFPQPYSYAPQYGGGYMYRSVRPQGQGRPYRKQSMGRGTCLFCESSSHYVL